jgi:hypothetical protein
LRRFQTAETGHCCVYNIDVSFGCIVTSCGWGGADPFGTIYYRMSGRQKSKKKSAARCFLAHVFIFLMKCSSSMSDYYQDESLKLKKQQTFSYIFKIAITR